MAVALDADQEALTFFSFPIEKQEETVSVNPVDGTPDIWIVGKATDGTVDADRQIVDPEWSASALREWAATGGNVRMAHDPKRPVGKGHDVQVTMDGHFVRSLISDPLAKHFIRTGVLNDYSVGISMPHVKFGPHKGLDPRGEATGGIITGRPDGLSKIAELSVVDRGSNFHSKFQIAKSAGGGEEFTGRMIGDEDEIAMAAPPGLLAKVSGFQKQSFQADYFPDAAPERDLSISFTPNDLARLVQAKYVEKHYDDLAARATAEKRDFDRGVGGGTDRDKLPEADFAGPHRSFPIVTQSDVSDALGLAGHADDPAAVRARIHAIARRKGLTVPGDGKSDKGTVAADETKNVSEGGVPDVAAVKEAGPDVTKEPEGTPEGKPEPARKAKGKPKGKKKLPPWLNKPADDDAKDGGDGACKSASEHLWTGVEGTSDIVCSKCHTTPAEAAGVTASPMDPAPVGELMESTMPASVKGATPQSASGASDAPHMDPVPQHREPDGAGVEPFEKDAGLPATGQGEAPTRLEAPTLKASPEVSALLRFRAIGIDPELGKLHDLTCPAYHPDEVQRFCPLDSIASLIDTGSWQRKSLEAACGPIERMLKMHELEQAAVALKSAGEADLNQWRLEAHKAFRDANPGPGTYPSPGMISPQKYNRPLITDGRAATSTGHSGPNTSPQVAAVAPNAHSFDRPPLADAHASPSPSFMKADFPYPAQQGMPTQLVYARQVQEQQRAALEQMHSHLGAMYPAVCPMDLNAPAPEMRHPVPATAGIGKGTGTEMHISVTGPDGAALSAEQAGAVAAQIQQRVMATRRAPVLAAEKARPEDDAGLSVDADVYKGFKKQRKKLGKKVLAGKMTVDEARARMGRRFAQKGAGEGEAVQMAAAVAGTPVSSTLPGAEVTYHTDGVLTPALVKSWVTEALHVETVPLEAVSVEAYDPGPVIEAAVTKAVTPLLEKIQATDTKLAEAQRVIDAIADQPDPATASFSGLAFSPVRKSSRPAGVTEIAEGAARARQNVIRELESIVNSASDPYEREAAYVSLRKYQGGDA